MSEKLKFAIQTAKKAGRLIIKESKKGFKISQKRGKNDLVTNIDKASEELIIREICKNYPDHEIIAEESSFQSEKNLKSFQNAKYIWIVDPIDGTTNFAHGLPIYAVSIALYKQKTANRSKNFQYMEGEIILGVIYAPKLDYLFYAEKNKGAFFNKQKIKVSDTKKLENSLLSTGFPYENKEINFPYFEKMTKKTRAVRRLGAATLDLAFIAAGKIDGHWEFNLKPWDIAAGALIIKEAGGKITDTSGNTLDLFGGDILATNGKIQNQIIKDFSTI